MSACSGGGKGGGACSSSSSVAVAEPQSASTDSSSSSAPLSTQAQHESFLALLHDSAGRAALFDFLRSGYSEHHLTFWEQTQLEFKQLESEAERAERARELFERYVRNGSTQQINLTEPQRMRLQAAIEAIGTKDESGTTRVVSPTLFDEAASTCLDLIKGNYYLPFQQSRQFASWKRKKAESEKKGGGQKSSACVML